MKDIIAVICAFLPTILLVCMTWYMVANHIPYWWAVLIVTLLFIPNRIKIK
jgi:hypothetical protein